ncbi:MAG: hypothetical protein GX279_10025 [Clostridiaceae bacterium]|nr:hypothetical protein [Clostridiaceae bacterium]
MKTLLKETDKWLRGRIRMVIWKQWKRVRTRYAMLKKLGISIPFRCFLMLFGVS